MFNKLLLVFTIILFPSWPIAAKDNLPANEWYCFFDNSREVVQSLAMGFDKINNLLTVIVSNGENTQVHKYSDYKMNPQIKSDIYVISAQADFKGRYDRKNNIFMIDSPALWQQTLRADQCDY